MATKINPDFYGAENTFVTITTDIAKKSAYTIADLFSNGNYTGGSYDATASPWGIGKSSISSDYQAQATKGATWTIYANENTKKNTPIWFYSNVLSVTGGDRPEEITGSSATAYRFARMLYKNRTSPAAELSGNNLLSKLAIDENDEISVPNTNTITPVTFLDYSKTRVCLGNVYYKVNGNPYFRSTSFSNFAAGGVTTDAIYGFDFSIRDISGNVLNVYASIGGGELPIPEYYKTCYYGDDAAAWVRPWRRIQSVGYWSIPNLAWREFDSSTGCINTADMETLNANDNATSNTGSNGWGHSSETLQVFDDVAYHWEMGFTRRVSSDWWSIDKVNTGDIYSSGLYRSFAYMAIDDGTADYESLTKAILHEVAFLGLPFCFSTSTASSTIGSDDIYLPVFNEHLITTGEYVNGSASLNLPNASWSDIFGADMPDYDPDYDPDAPPEPGEEDQGDLSNSYPNRYSNAGGLAQWVVSYNQVEDLAAFLNGSYLPTTADLDADFKGTNPQDYIVSVQKYPFTLPIQGTSVPTDIYIGKINSGIKGKKLYDDIFVHAVNAQVTFDFGTLEIPEYYGDFRDYQSKILLFMPFIGTDELDPKLYIGNTLSLIYKVDFNTGSVAAEIKRNGLTMETKTGNISITIPFMAANMGQYQNQLAQLSYAKDLTKIKGIGTALSAGFTMAAGAQATMSTGQPPLAAGSNLAQAGVQLAANATQLSQLDYQIEHTAPSVGTISTAAAANAFFLDDRARLIIIRPKTLAGFDSAAYAHTVGHACCIPGKLSNFSGYTIAAAAELSNITTKSAHYAATEQELELIKKALQAGVYL